MSSWKIYRSLFLVLFLVLSGLLGGCARVSRPGKSLVERLNYDQTIQARYQLDRDWWLVYGDRRLDALVRVALQNNLDLVRAAVNVNRALFQANLVGVNLIPVFTEGLSVSARKNIKEGGSVARSVDVDFGLKYEVDLWRRLAASLSAAQWEYQATLEDLDAARLVLINSVVNTYYRLAYLNDALAEAEAGLKNLRSIEEKILVKRQAGRGAAVEPAQAAQVTLSAENNLLDYLRQRKTAEETLRNLLNLNPSDPLDLEDLTLDYLQLPELDLNVPLAVLAARPDLRAAEFRLRRAFKNIEEAEASWFPSITVNAALSSERVGFSQAFNAPVASLGLIFNLPFLNWNAILVNLRISEADFEEARLNFEQALTVALNEVDRCYYIYKQASRELVNTRKKYAYDLKIGCYYRDRYQSGAVELSDWLNAENAVNASRLATLNAFYQTIKAENQTYQALAGRCLDHGG
ncbi:MAG: hypothetical protein AMR96_02135 [Candidatus Adiutrix intracellularis]|jgi:outer membrane protein TolC|nr:MAG: hypothetical protein AMR96_02135 [Candidatus Adiutrix intracellularis]MDR2827485.1 TolC family protein [Candidatus Adiutrix intracellularis]